MRPHRIANWDVALVEWAEAMRGARFVWGETDCAALVRQALTMMYGEDVVPDLRGWSSQFGAWRRFAEVGGVEGVLYGLGASLVGIRFAQSGDFVIERPQGPRVTGYAAGVVLHGRVVTAAEDVGVIIGPLSAWSAETAWRLP